jgi:hypothetical protein
MLTERVARWVDEHLTESPFTAETQAILERYSAPESPERRRQYTELSLVAACCLIIVALILGLALAGASLAALGSPQGGIIYRIGVAGLTWCCVGIVLHLWRYYDALMAIRRSDEQERGPARWPRTSSDLDFVIQAVVAVSVAVIA